jgi:NADH:ubiquinone oxidoreductase 49 kD subunit 7
MQASERTLNEIKAKLPYVEVKKDKLLSVVYVQKELLINTLKAIKEDFGFKLFIDHSVVDTLEAQNRFEAFYILYNVDTKERIVVKTRTEHSLPSAEKLWFAAKWAERECYDMFGINYEGHEHLVRAFMWDTYSYHPLRKDFPLQGYETVELPSLNETVFGDTLSGTMNYRRTHTYVPTLKDLEYTEKNRIKKKAQVVLNWGPLHPGTHGTMWFLFDLEGERIVQTDVILGQLHRGVEKLAEHEPYQQFLVYTDRMDYISALCSNQAWTVAVERLLGIEDIVPLKAKYIRTMMSELQRINSHLLWLGTYALDLGALTIFLYAFKEREK